MIDRICGWLFMVKKEQVDKALCYRVLKFEGIPEEFIENIERQYDFKIRKNKEFILGCFEAGGYNWDLESEDCAAFLVMYGAPYKMVHDCMREYDGKIEETIASFHKGRRRTSFKEQSILQKIVYLQGKDDTPEEVLDELYKEMSAAQKEADKAAGITRRRRGGRSKAAVKSDAECPRAEKGSEKTKRTKKKSASMPADSSGTAQEKLSGDETKKGTASAKIIQFRFPEN